MGQLLFLCSGGLIFGAKRSHPAYSLDRWDRLASLLIPPVHLPAPMGPFPCLWCAHRSINMAGWNRLEPTVEQVCWNPTDRRHESGLWGLRWRQPARKQQACDKNTADRRQNFCRPAPSRHALFSMHFLPNVINRSVIIDEKTLYL